MFLDSILIIAILSFILALYSLKKENHKKELNKAKTMTATDWSYNNETDSNIAMTLGEYEILSKAEDAVKYIDEIKKMTAEDIRIVLKKYCNLNAYTLCYVKPKGK